MKPACISLHLAKIQEMKSIFKPQMPIEIYLAPEILSTDDFRILGLILARSRNLHPMGVVMVETGYAGPGWEWPKAARHCRLLRVVAATS